MKTLEDLTIIQRENLDVAPYWVYGESLSEFLKWEEDGFGDFTVSEMASLFYDLLRKERKKKILKKGENK